jgi:hypothetical protein
MAFEFSETTKQSIYNRQNGVCAHCGKPGIANYHHIVPRQSGDPTNMSHGWLAGETNGVGLCSFDHAAMHIGDNPEFKVQYKDGAVPPASYFKHAFGPNDQPDRQKQRAWAAEHQRKANPVWDDLARRNASSQSSNTSPSGVGGATVNLALKRARLRRKSGGFVDLSLRSGKGVDKGQAAAWAMLVGMTIGAAFSSALACRNEEYQQKDLLEWEEWIGRQQLGNPSAGYMLAVQYSIYEQGPTDPVVRYVLTAGYPASTVEKAAELMRRDPPDAMLARSGEYDAGKYIYPEPMLHWYPPRAAVGANVANQKLRAVMAAMEPPSDDREAFQILDETSMTELLQIYPELFKNAGYSPLWRSIDRARVNSPGRLHAAVRAIHAKQQGLSFGNFKANAGIQLPPEGTADYHALAAYFGADRAAKTVPEWLQGWWTVYDGNYYFYYFSDSPVVVFTKVKPVSSNSPAPKNPHNRGTIVFTENGCKITWGINGSGGPTIENFSQLHGKGDEMNGTSNKYSPLFARKLR